MKPKPVVRRKDLRQYTGLAHTQNDELINNDPSFPKGFRISDRSRTRVWFEDEIADWQQARKAKAE